MINLAFVGLGWWGMELARAAARSRDRIAIAGGYSPVPAETSEFQKTFGGQIYKNLTEILDDGSVNGIVFSTPHSMHAAQVREAAVAGKHIFVEKPLALSVADAVKADKTCRDNKVVLAVGHNRRFSAATRQLEDWIAEGCFGRILHFEAHFSGNSALNFTPETWRANRTESPAGSLVSIGLHMIDAVQFLLGPIQRLSCISKRQVLQVDIDDTTAALFELETGITGSLGTLFVTPLTSSLKIYGTNGLAEATDDFTRLFWTGENHQRSEVDLQPIDTLSAELVAFQKSCEDGIDYPLLSSQAIKNVAVIEAMSASAAESGAWTKVR